MQIPSLSRRTLAVVVVGAVLVLLAAGLALTRVLGAPGTDLERAVRLAPADTERYSWTDWAGVRRELDLPASPDSLDALVDRGFETDLTSTSGLVESSSFLAEQLAWSPATISWELLAQSETGVVDIVGLGDVDTEPITDRLAALGFQRPEEDDGVWVGGAEVLAQATSRAGGSATPVLSHVVVDADRGLLLASDNQVFLGQAAEQAQDLHDPDSAGVLEAVEALAQQPLSAAVYTGRQACASLSMGQADPTDQDAADELVRQAGELDPVAGFAMGVQPGLGVEVALAFETEDQARTNADTRATLASGPAPGQGGAFSDRFALESAVADGRTLVLTLVPEPGTYVLSDLSTGPVLFASC